MIERVCQLPPLQHGVLFEALRQQGSRRMMYQARLDLAGPVRPELLRRSWHEVVRRHTSLRSSYHYERLDTPVQVVRRDADPDWRELDWRDEPDQEERLADLLAADREVPFELTRAPLLRLVLVRVGRGTVLATVDTAPAAHRRLVVLPRPGRRLRLLPRARRGPGARVPRAATALGVRQLAAAARGR